MKKGFIDGCFDGLHYGHINALYEAKSMCDYLIAGTHTDEEIEKAKGVRPIYSYKRRLELLKSCKFVDEVVDAVPYNTTEEIIKKYNCDYFFHGDDGLEKSPLKELKESGVLKIYKRTRGVSSTGLRKRISSYKAGNDVVNNKDNIYLKYLYEKIRGKGVEGRDIIVIKYCWDFLGIEHINMIKRIRDWFPGYELCVDMREGGEIYNKLETGVMLIGIEGIDRVFFDKPKGNYNNVVTINTNIKIKGAMKEYEGYEVNGREPESVIASEKSIKIDKEVPDVYYEIIKKQYESIIIWLKSEKFKENDIIVLDIDEVCLSNLKYFGYKNKESKKYNFENGLIRGIKFIKPVFDYLHKNGIKYAFVTGRNEYIRDITIQNLEMEGMNKYEELYMCENEFKGDISKFKENCRLKLKEKGYKIRGCIGDQISDMTGYETGICFLIFNAFYETK